MSADETVATVEQDVQPRRTMFRRTATPKMDVEAAARQGRAVSLAIAAFGNGGDAIAFLNAHDDRLGARPIDLAVAGADGLAQVEHAIAAAAGR